MTDVEQDLMDYLRSVSEMTQGRSLEGVVLKHVRICLAQKLPSGCKRGPKGMCFMNAYHLVCSKPELSYVEGFAMTEVVPIAIRHAWAVDKQNQVYDNTWKTVGVAYFGIVMKLNQVNKIIFETKRYGVLDFSSAAFRKMVEVKDA